MLSEGDNRLILQEPYIDLVDEIMTLAFAISMQVFVELRKNNMDKKDNLQTQINFSAYSAATKRYAIWYHVIKSSPSLNQQKQLSPSKLPPPNEYVTQFYTEGTKQNEWRLMHNELRTQFECLVDKEELESKKIVSRYEHPRQEIIETLDALTQLDIALESYKRPQTWS